MKKVERHSFRVEVYPRYRPVTEEDCRLVAAEIEEHIQDIGTPRVVWETEETCEYCGQAWDEDAVGGPGCCAKAQAEWELAWWLEDKATAKASEEDGDE